MKKLLFNKKNILPGVLLLTVFLCVSSCKKLIEIPANPPNALPETAVFADSATTMGAMAGVYSYYFNEFGFYDGNLSKLTGLSSDELETTATYDPNILAFYGNGLKSDNSYVSSLWTTIYNALYNVNVCIIGIDGSTGLSAPLKQQLLGELKVLRALYYFNMVNLYGRVPLVLTTDFHTTATLSQSSTDDIYAQVFKDLTEAQKALKPEYPSDGHARINLYTAEALLAKVYLYKGQWKQALDMSGDIIKSGVYHLEEDDLNNVFLDGSAEAIWQIPITGLSTQTNEAANYVPYANSVIPTYILSGSLKKAFEPGDKRLDSWVGKNTVNVDGKDSVFYYPFKYKNVYVHPTNEDFMVFRLSEQYLIRAEANANLGNLPAALDDLLQVRHRAGLAQTNATSKEDILTAIYKERQVEMFCEWGNRWYDLKRTKTIDAVLGAEKTGWQPNAALYPIPYSEIRKNTRLIQNPGYN